MENTEIINIVIGRMIEEGLWFTTKNDPTFQEAPSYYELDQFGDPTEKAIKEISKQITNKIGDGAINIEDAIELWLNEQAANYRLAYTDVLVTNFEPKPVVDNIEAYETPATNLCEDKEVEDKTIKTENIKNRLKEENTKSLNLIGDKLSDPDFDADSEDGQIILRTSQLFNALSDEGIDVEVTFDNGESQTMINIPQGGQVNITIRSSKEPLKAFISGQVELDEDLLKEITSILNVIEEV